MTYMYVCLRTGTGNNIMVAHLQIYYATDAAASGNRIGCLEEKEGCSA